MSLNRFLGQLLAVVGIGTLTDKPSAAAPTPTPTTSVRTAATPTFPIPNWNGTIPKGAALYHYKYECAGHKGTIEVLARNKVNAYAKALKRLESHYDTSVSRLELVGTAAG